MVELRPVKIFLKKKDDPFKAYPKPQHGFGSALRGFFVERKVSGEKTELAFRSSSSKGCRTEMRHPKYISTVLFERGCFVKRGIERVKILAVQMILRDAKGIAKALVMDDLALAQILDGIAHIGIVDHTQ